MIRPLTIGQPVRVKDKSTDRLIGCGYTSNRRRQIGIVVTLGEGSVGGTSEDPEVFVAFADGEQEMFWREELAIPRRA